MHDQRRSLKRTFVEALDRVMRRFSTPTRLPRMWVVPSFFGSRWRRYGPHTGAWPVPAPVPGALRDIPGIQRYPALEDEADRDEPLHDWLYLYPETAKYIMSHGWTWFLWSAPRKSRAKRAAGRRIAAGPTRGARSVDPVELTAALKRRAAELGISACGIAPLDKRYIFAEFREDQVGDRVVVCALESQWEACQTAPSLYAERALVVASVELYKLVAKLGELLLESGYQIRLPKGDAGDGVALNFAVEAGLGQMGLNGQVLTPQAGSRVRFLTMTTDAPLVFDRPVDYGIKAVCDACQVCVRRCPSGAISAHRKVYRGVEKAKLNAARCVPVVAQTPECAICMKVCPVQRYGLDAVSAELERSGRILGKDTEELESYVIFGQRYGLGERPRLSPEFFAAVPYESGRVALPTRR